MKMIRFLCCVCVFAYIVVANASLSESIDSHELWDISYDMTLEECMELLETEKGLIFDAGEDSFSTSTKQHISFLGYDARIIIWGNNQNLVDEIRIEFDFMDESKPVSHAFYQSFDEAIESAYPLLDIIPDVFEALTGTYGPPTNGFFVCENRMSRSYNLPYKNGQINIDVIRQAFSENGRIFFMTQFNNVEFSYFMRLNKSNQMYEIYVESCSLIFRANARNDAYDGIQGNLGEYPMIKKDISLEL